MHVFGLLEEAREPTHANCTEKPLAQSGLNPEPADSNDTPVLPPYTFYYTQNWLWFLPVLSKIKGIVASADGRKTDDDDFYQKYWFIIVTTVL